MIGCSLVETVGRPARLGLSEVIRPGVPPLPVAFSGCGSVCGVFLIIEEQFQQVLVLREKWNLHLTCNRAINTAPPPDMGWNERRV